MEEGIGAFWVRLVSNFGLFGGALEQDYCRSWEAGFLGLVEEASRRDVLWGDDMGSVAHTCTDSVHPVAVLLELGLFLVGVRWNASAGAHAQVFLQ